MRVNKRLLIIIEPKIIHFDLHKDVWNNLKHEMDSIIKHNKSLAENTINTNMETIFMYTKNSKTTEPYKFVLHLSKRLD